MEFIEIYHEVRVELLLWVPELVVFLDFCQEENSNTPAILIVDQTRFPICMVDDPFQNLYAGEN
jgi:hypothetical protein